MNFYPNSRPSEERKTQYHIKILGPSLSSFWLTQPFYSAAVAKTHSSLIKWMLKSDKAWTKEARDLH